MDPYKLRGLARAPTSEIREHIADKIGATVVSGLGEVIDQGDAIAGGERTVTFTETSDLREWYLPLTAQRGLTWRTEPVPSASLDRVAFVLALGFGNGSPLPQPSGQWDIYVEDRFAVSVRVVNHSQLWRGPECSLTFTANRLEAAPPFGSLCLSSVLTNEAFATFGPALLTVPTSWLPVGQPATIRVEAVSDVPSTRWFQLAVVPDILGGTDIYRAVDLLASDGVHQVGDWHVYFGDIHTHSGLVRDHLDDRLGCGRGTREENYEYARGPGGLDFYALTEHEWQIDPDRMDDYFGQADHYNEEGHFVCLPAYEFTSFAYGHRNVYFRSTQGATVIPAHRDWAYHAEASEVATSPEELWAQLEQTGVDFFTVPHHSSATPWPCNVAIWHPQHDRLLEVYSCWGSSEYYGDFPRGISDRYRTLDARDALSRGLRAGFIASSDGHDGRPGNVQSPWVKHHGHFHHLGSGRAAVLCQDLTRDEVFDALYARRCYATTGPPIVLSFTVNDQQMGAELPALPEGERPRLQVTCRGSNGLDHVRIIKNGRVVSTIPCHGEFEYELEWEHADYRPDTPSYYYVRIVQVDGESAWSSPIWVG